MHSGRAIALVASLWWSCAASAQLVVHDDPVRVANPADQVPYPAGVRNCNNTLADAAVRAAMRAIDQCPEEFFRSREAYYAYAQQATFALLVPGAAQAAGALALDKAKENALFCLSDALIDESGASETDRVFLKSLVQELKEDADRDEFIENTEKLAAAFRERGFGAYFRSGDLNTFVNTLDVTLQERAEGVEAESGLVEAGRARTATEAEALAATREARELARECRFGDAASGLAKAQQANLAHLARLRAKVADAKHFRYCLERNARQQPINALSPASPFLLSSLQSADAEVQAAEALDADQTKLIGDLAALQQSVEARRNDIAVLRDRATRRLESARKAAGACNWNAAASALDTVASETLECALELDDVRREREALAGQIESLKTQIGSLENEYQRAMLKPFAELASCGDFSLFAGTIDELQGECRTLIGADAKVAALRERARVCADDRLAGQSEGALTGKAEVAPVKFEDHGNGNYTRSTYGETKHTWERVDRGYPFSVTISWDYAHVPNRLKPGDRVTIIVTGGVVSESPKGAGDGMVLAGAVAVFGDVTVVSQQQADRGHPVGRYEFVVNPGAANVEIHLGGAPMGTGAIWKYTRAR